MTAGDPGERAATTAAVIAAGWPPADELSADPPPAARMCTHCLRRSGQPQDTVLGTVLCTPCWAELAEDTTPDPGTGFPRGLPRTAQAWCEAIRASAWYRRLRRDARRRLDALLGELARRADWTDHLTWPTWKRLQDATGWARSSVASWLAKLQKSDWLVLIEPGSTPQYRGPLQSMIHGRHGNRAAVYQLHLPDHAITDTNTAAVRDDLRPLTETGTIPSPTHDGGSHGSLRGESWTPTGFTLTEGKSSVHTRATTIIHNRVRARAGAEPPRQGRRWGDWFDERVPVSRGEMLAAARQLRDDPLLARLSPRAIRAQVKVFWRAGWTNNDLRYALAHQPTPARPPRLVERCPAGQVRFPSAWLRHRLAPWQGPHGPLVAPHADVQARAAIAARYGRAAAQRLPYGHTQLSPDALGVDDTHRADARAVLACNQAHDQHALRSGLVPDQDPASTGTRQATRAQITALLQARCSRHLSAAGTSC
ncbi:hypothetical protein [Pseudonocardia sp. ICBG601]|uniref:hypothetical protein n=1 Tax=Pseudonocardia sp. ICBG601 TaxID=2846759 RepID=UPI001CF65ACF|nr:hypothetical protein [Pseudonocardia sp. ICBG601]